MRSRVAEAIAKIKSNGWVEDLRKCPTLKERYQGLLGFLPEISKWDVSIAKNQLLFYAQMIFSIDLGVCPSFWGVSDHYQYCLHIGYQNQCTCRIPQPLCVFRDQDGKPKYPEFFNFFF